MSIVQTSLQVLPAANDATTFYVELQPFTSGKTYEKFVSPNLTFNPKTKQFAINGKNISKNKVTTSATAPLNPSVGDLWYDNTTDITFSYNFDGATYNWVDISSPIIASANYNYLAPPPPPVKGNPIGPYTIQYLMVAGGGGGGSPGCNCLTAGGGGAGGLVLGQITTGPGISFNLTVGGGGVGGTAAPYTSGYLVLTGKSGTPSTLSAPTITTITAVGGGGGASSAFVIPNQYGYSGGSGGGGWGAGGGTQPAQNPGNPLVTAQYGNPGGAFSPAQPTYGAGGGGASGPGGVGGAGVARGGGAGYTWPYTASTYAAGGNTSSFAYNVVSNGNPGPTGSGNGGQISTGFNPTSGSGGNGGPGVIIFVVPNAAYPSITAPGATVTTPASAPGNTVLTYTTSSLTPATFTYIA